MSTRPGFDVANIDVDKRAVAHQEFVNRCVLSKNLRVLFIPNAEKLPTKALVKKFLNEIVRYNNEKDSNPLGWAKPAGSFKGTSNFRAEMSSSFWDYFMETGRKNLLEYNKSNHCAVKVVRDQTLKLSDVENLRMSTRPGFDVANIDVDKRAVAHQEFVNRCVLSKNLRVLFIPNAEKLPTKALVKKFLNEIVRYNNEKDSNPLGWAKPAGSFKGTSNFRAEMSSSFWDYFMETGRKNLLEYNKSNHCAVKVVRDQTLKLSDVENLSLYLRRKIVKYTETNKTGISEVLVKNGMITLKDSKKNTKKYKATTMAIMLGWDFSDWKGAAIKTMLSEEERSDYDAGLLKWKSITLETLFDNNEVEEVVEHAGVNNSDSKKDEGPVTEEQRNKRKRDGDGLETNMQKMRRCEEVATPNEE